MGTQCAVGVSAKRSYGGVDHYPSVQKGQTPPRSGYEVRSGYAVCSRCKCEKVIWVVGTITLQCKKVKPPHAVGMQYAVGTQCTVGVSAKRSYGWWGPLPFSAKRSNPPRSGYAVCSGHAVCSRCKCKKVMWVVGTVNLQCKKVKPPTQWVRSTQWVCSEQ